MGFFNWLADCLFWDNLEDENRKYLWFHNDQTEYATNPDWNYDQDDWRDSDYDDNEWEDESCGD
jgi:hypothetical protein